MPTTSRRECLQATGFATLAGAAARAQPPSYDLLIKGGRVIDPSQRLDRIIDIAIAKGTIARLRPDISTAQAKSVVDARGKIVAPGLVDIHAHVSLDQVIAAATTHAARAISAFRDFGTLRVGAVADIALFELGTGEVAFVDNVNATRIGKQKLVPAGVVVGGRYLMPTTIASGPRSLSSVDLIEQG